MNQMKSTTKQTAAGDNRQNGVALRSLLGDVPTEVTEFANERGITQHLEFAVTLAEECFGTLIEPSVRLDWDEYDEGEVVRYLVLSFGVPADVDRAYSAYQEFTRKFIAAVPSPERRLILISYDPIADEPV
jgi:hypothetical protein